MTPTTSTIQQAGAVTYRKRKYQNSATSDNEFTDVCFWVFSQNDVPFFPAPTFKKLLFLINFVTNQLQDESSPKTSSPSADDDKVCSQRNSHMLISPLLARTSQWIGAKTERSHQGSLPQPESLNSSARRREGRPFEKTQICAQSFQWRNRYQITWINCSLFVGEYTWISVNSNSMPPNLLSLVWSCVFLLTRRV